MEEEYVSKGYYNDYKAPNKMYLIWGIIFAVITPPVGIFIGILGVVVGRKNSNDVLIISFMFFIFYIILTLVLSWEVLFGWMK
jgi:ammonia channel protein AmtB